MGDTQPATMEEIALKLWALRTGQMTMTRGSDAGDETVDQLPVAPLTISKKKLEGQAVN